MIALDWMLFGNGHGMKSPYCDDIFYWLHDYADSNTRQREIWPTEGEWK
jgi:hypothetical protein